MMDSNAKALGADANISSCQAMTQLYAFRCVRVILAHGHANYLCIVLIIGLWHPCSKYNAGGKSGSL